jgi:DinB superfamily
LQNWKNMEKLKLIKNIREASLLLENTIKENITEADFNSPIDGKWSAAGHIQHLINSIKPLNQVFLAPKFLLKLITGKPNRKSRSYEKLVEKYLEKLKTANPTTNRFGPKEGKIYTKKDLRDRLLSEYTKFEKNIEKKWDEESLDMYLIPHPLLGKLTVREMVMFTIYHSHHHQKAITA